MLKGRNHMSNLFDGLEVLGFQDLEKVELYKQEQEKALHREKAAIKKEISSLECLFDKSYTCPVCGHTFKERTIKKGKSRPVSSDSDLKPYYEPIDPMYYDIVLCPSCGYAALTSSFGKLGYTQSKWIREEITPKFKYREYPEVYDADTAIERYKLALLNTIAKKAKDGEKAYICMKIAWLYRDKQDPEKELIFIEHAYTGFKHAYANESFPICGIDENTMTYLIGEFARKLGYLEEAIRWIGTVILAKNVNQRLKDRAIDLKEQIREAMNQNK